VFLGLSPNWLLRTALFQSRDLRERLASVRALTNGRGSPSNVGAGATAANSAKTPATAVRSAAPRNSPCAQPGDAEPSSPAFGHPRQSLSFSPHNPQQSIRVSETPPPGHVAPLPNPSLPPQKHPISLPPGSLRPTVNSR